MKPFCVTTRLTIALLLLASFGRSGAAIAAAPASDFWDEPGVRLLNQPISEYRGRRQKLLTEIKDGVVVILGNAGDDVGEDARYRQNNWMAYLTGVRTPGAAVMLVPPGLPSLNGAREIVFIPPRNPFMERWTGIQIGPGEEAARTFGVERVLSNQELWAKLREASTLAAFKNAQGESRMKLYMLAPGRIKNGNEYEFVIRNGNVREYKFAERVRKELTNVEVVSVASTIAEMRKIKSAAEIALLQKAIDITGEAHRDIMAHLRPGLYEYEVQAILEAAFTRNGAERPGFPSIVGSGINSTILHYDENHKKIDPDDLVVCDIGAEYSLYTADITRTYPASGKFTPRQRAIYRLVLDTQTAAAAHWKLGMTNNDLDNFAKEFLRQSPLRAKDVDGKEYTMDHFFIHGLGHYLGMDVHDVGDYRRPIQPGEVFTIEPGIYIPAEKLGVRIEDDYIITPENTLRKLSEKIPSSPDDIERLMAQAAKSRKG